MGSDYPPLLSAPSRPDGELCRRAAVFDGLCTNVAQGSGFGAYLQGLLLPPDRLKTLTASLAPAHRPSSSG